MNPARRAFTLVELVLVLALLVVLTGIAAPSLSRSFRGRGLEEEAVRLLAMTELARDEAVSQGVPMCVWIAPATDDGGGGYGGEFGCGPKTGFIAAGHTQENAQEKREKKAALRGQFRFDAVEAPTDDQGRAVIATFDPDGTLNAESLPALRLLDKREAAIAIAQNADQLGYEIRKEPEGGNAP